APLVLRPVHEGCSPSSDNRCLIAKLVLEDAVFVLVLPRILPFLTLRSAVLPSVRSLACELLIAQRRAAPGRLERYSNQDAAMDAADQPHALPCVASGRKWSAEPPPRHRLQCYSSLAPRSADRMWSVTARRV